MAFTKEQLSISGHNCKLAWKHFYPECKGSSKNGYVLHHVDDSWRHSNIERYIQWNIDDLQMLTKAEHNSLHHKGKKREPFSEEWKAKLSANNAHYWKGISKSEETKAKISASKKGKTREPFSEEHKAKISASMKGNKNSLGLHWWNHGVVNVSCKECPEGFVHGRLNSDKYTKKDLLS